MGFPLHAVIVTAAGRSDRFNITKNEGVKKEYLSIEGHTVLYRSVVPFLQIPNCQAIVVTCPKGMEDQCAVALEDLFEQNQVPVVIANGGESRQASVYNALKMIHDMALPIDYVAIHDGARCYISPSLIIRTLATATVFKGAVPALPPTDALKTIDENGVLCGHIDRSRTVAVQTPQIFHFPEIFYAHQVANTNEKTYVDDTEIFSDFGQSVGICEGERENKKITYIEDIPDAEQQIAQYLIDLEKGRQSAQAARALHEAMQSVKQEQGTV
ncbi:4-diphosphocytidyl-2-methyl-D-erythritol synthase [Sphaerochaeta pleomorpha str. Grapes]|uniref:4-diphosphocytidyl-2-methyl-D-erythritol synthase n=1 Tax=Sphaerochaeta pleomorpha (strain ATCC BAA-1885 / DSM 22778 / Grapes) TaxID=158190 RepID=G8QT92_SPHPG|nr:IspD/TarI family cytidylyltransferase [Sphaerochaeta pleomorpha]AEV29059.1 4-diphosphocytidyl-2-methyl-D-erythritol synthase [Sphaerochaeta pleomorpha str. Grapes]